MLEIGTSGTVRGEDGNILTYSALRLEWQGQDGQQETEQPDHSASLSDFTTSSTRIRFSVHTAMSPAYPARQCHQPWFVAAFALLVAINSAGLIPAGRQRLLQTLLTWLLVISTSAIEMKAHLKDFATVGFKPILLMVSETVFPAILVIAFIVFAR